MEIASVQNLSSATNCAIFGGGVGLAGSSVFGGSFWALPPHCRSSFCGRVARLLRQACSDCSIGWRQSSRHAVLRDSAGTILLTLFCLSWWEIDLAVSVSPLRSACFARGILSVFVIDPDSGTRNRNDGIRETRLLPAILYDPVCFPGFFTRSSFAAQRVLIAADD